MFIEPDEIAELIATEQYSVHTEYHEKLKEFSESNSMYALLGGSQLQDVFNGVPQPPPKPKR